MTRRLWRPPTSVYRGMSPRHDTWVKHFLKCQGAQCSPTLRDIALHCGCDPVLVWKIEHDKGVSARSLRDILVKGLGFAPESCGRSRS